MIDIQRNEDSIEYRTYHYRRRRYESEKQLFRKLNLSPRALDAAIKESAERWKI